ncbi:hypothetical protein [Falsochrobactrum shanghaiense]|nr:hypothetical protein [Falsochrobactrum shanghaiense]
MMGWGLRLRQRFQNAVKRARQRLGWHVLAFAVILLCAALIVLELVPSRTFVRTTFTATIETQEVRFRLGEQQAALTGISGNRILARELVPSPGEAEVVPFDLGDPSEPTHSSANGDLELLAQATDAYLEIDRLWLPPHTAVKIASGGEGSTLALEFIETGADDPIDVRFVWRGAIASSQDAAPTLVGSRIWQADKPSLTIDEARIRGLVPVPIHITNIAFDRVLSGDEYQSPVSAVISGELQFDIAGFPGRPHTIREGETLSFDGLKAQMLNLSQSDKGFRFLLIGSADAVSLGFLTNHRDVQPSMLNAILARESLTILASALFAMLLALMGAINFGGKK